MGLQKINWTQIDAANVPDGVIVDIGSQTKPVHAVYADNLYFSGTSISNLLTGLTGSDTYVTGFTYNNANTLTLQRNQGQPDLTATINTMTGLTVNGSISGTTIRTDNLVLSGTSITNIHNDLSGLQGGITNQYYHLPLSGYSYLTDVVDNDKIGLILGVITIHPTYTSPSSSITNVTNTYEIGSTQPISITQTFTQGDAGTKSSETINKNGGLVSTSPTFSESLVIVPSTTYNGTVTYGQGNCKVNNIGLVDCVGRIVSGTTTSATRTISGIYPIFYYKSSSPITDTIMVNAITGGTATKLVSVSTGTIIIPYNLSSQYMAVAYPASSTTKTVYFVTSLDSGSIGGIFPNLYTLNVNSPNNYWSNVSYKIHTSNIINNSAANIELRNS